MRTAMLIVPAIITVTLTSCAGGSAAPAASPTTSIGASEEATRTVSPSPSALAPTPAPDTSPQAARAEYQTAIDALVDADSGRFNASVGTDDYGAKVGGGYELSSRSAAVDAFYGDADGQVGGASFWLGDRGLYRRFNQRGEADELFADPCWTAYDAEPGPADGATMRATHLGFPAAVDVLLAGRGFLRTGTRIRATTDLYLIARAFGPRMAQALSLPARRGGRGTIIVDLDNGIITGWSTTTANFLTEVEAAGHTLPPELADFASLAQSSGSINVTLTDPGSLQNLEPPADAPLC